MDKKYKAIKTLNQLDLSRSARSSLSSAKSTFSTKSQENRFNEAYAKDFSITPPKKDFLQPKKSSPKDPLSKKLSAINLKPKSASPPKSASRPKSASPPKTDSDKVLNPLTGRLVSLAYYNKLVKSGALSTTNAKTDSIKKDSGKVLNPLTGKLVSLAYYNKLVKSGALSTTSAKKESPKKEFSWSPPPPVKISLKPQTFKREPNTKAWDYYTKALELRNIFRKDKTDKQQKLIDDVLYNIIILLNRNKGDFYEQEELPSLVQEVFQEYYYKGEDKYNERYSQFAIVQNGEADYTTFEGQLDNLVSTIYEGEEAKK